MLALVYYPAGKDAPDYALPAGVNTSHATAFEGCENLKSIRIPAGITSIGDDAFYRCRGLTSISLLASIPPALERELWPSYNAPPSSIIICVPAASVEACKNAVGWKNYADRIQAAP
jgi:hypothetical protein